MCTYYLHDGHVQSGPFTIEELRQKGLKINTLVWYDGAGDWTEAGKVEELKILFAVIPPPVRSKVVGKAKEVSEKEVAKSGTLRTVIILAILAILGYGGYNIYQKQQDGIRMSEVQEKKNYVRDNIHSFVKTGNSAYHINGLGGIYGLSISVANNTDYVMDNVRVVIRYIKANGETWKEEPLEFVLVGPHQQMELRAPDSDRGTSIDYKIVQIKSGALGL